MTHTSAALAATRSVQTQRCIRGARFACECIRLAYSTQGFLLMNDLNKSSGLTDMMMHE